MGVVIFTLIGVASLFLAFYVSTTSGDTGRASVSALFGIGFLLLAIILKLEDIDNSVRATDEKE